MEYPVTILPENRILTASHGENLLKLLTGAGLAPDAPCGGNGKCGKCTVLVDGKPEQSCRYRVTAPIRVELPAGEISTEAGLTARSETYSLAVDIGTTGVVCALLTQQGEIAARCSTANPQRAHGADVVSRIANAMKGAREEMTGEIRRCVTELTEACCRSAGCTPDRIRRVCTVGNPCMQQLFFGMETDNLAAIPFTPAIREERYVPAGEYIPILSKGEMRILPCIAGYIGSDALAGMLASGMDRTADTVAFVDIGTNAEILLCHKGRIAACAAAAGPALEGGNISCGMRAQPGAVDHITHGVVSVIGGGKAKGICGSGLIDGTAYLLDRGLLDRRGRLLTEDRRFSLTEGVTLTQEDIRQVQLAKGAIRAGIALLTQHMGIREEEVDRCILAGAFGSEIRAESACRIGLLPEEWAKKTVSRGNLALEGAAVLAQGVPCPSREIAEPLELGSLPGFAKAFARHMGFREETWLIRARECGFTHGAPLDVATLTPMETVRAACEENRCGSYGKNWTCPPYCGSLEECRERMHGYSRGIIVQTVYGLKKTVDTKGYAEAERRHGESLRKLARLIRREYPDALCLGSGGCRICPECALPEPCRAPEEAYASMEAYGLFVTHVCRDNGLGYHYGEKTVTYTACILF